MEEQRRIIDCFLFSNETDILLYRLKILDPVVDFFVIVEADMTFVGNSKPFVFDIHHLDECFQPFLYKIVHLKLHRESFPCPQPDISKGEQWQNEHYQRDVLSDALNGFDDKDIVLLSDVDEIYDPNTLNELRTIVCDDVLYTFQQKYHSYNLNVVRVLDWFHPKAFTIHMWKTVLNKLNFSCIRLKGVTEAYNDSAFVNLVQGGWHLSYFGDVPFITEKLRNFSHQEFNNEYIINERGIQNRIQEGLDIMERSCIQYHRVPICRNTYLPPQYDTLLSKFVMY